MSAPTQLQQTALADFAGGNNFSSNGSTLDPLLKAAIDAACAEYPVGPGTLGIGDAIDIFTGYFMLRVVSGLTLEPDSSSENPTLAFVGRVMEIYAEQNP